MIRVAILDRHAAVRAGLDAVLRAHPDPAPAGDPTTLEELSR